MLVVGTAWTFPNPEFPSVDTRKDHLLSIINATLDQTDVEYDETVLTLELRPPAILSNLPEAAHIAIANIEEMFARDMFSRERFNSGDEMFERVTNQFPLVPQVWLSVQV